MLAQFESCSRPAWEGILMPVGGGASLGRPSIANHARGSSSVNRTLCDVIIPTKDRPERLLRTLEGLLGQTHKDFGVIVVDDASTRPIHAIVGDDRVRSLGCNVVTLPAPSGPAAARNAGVAASQAKFVLFIDDDVVPDRRLVELHLGVVLRANTTTGPIVSCGPFVQPADWENPTPWNLWEAHQARKEADALVRGDYAPTWRQFHTGNNCLPVDAFRAVGGFDQRFLRAEDDEFALRLERHGCSFVFEPAAIAWHYSHRTLEAWLKTPRAYAYFDYLIDRLHPETRYLAQVKTELRGRRLPLRLARVLAKHRATTRLGVDSFVTLSRMAHALGYTWLMMGSLSVAYDLSYCRSLSEAERGRSEFEVESARGHAA
jgi:GT2 family glycosyltransferase